MVDQITVDKDTFDSMQKCSPFSESSGDEAIGQARFPNHLIFLESALPWPSNFVEAASIPEGVPSVVKEVADSGQDLTVLGLVPDDDYSVEGFRHVIRWSRPEGLFSGFEKDDYLVPEAEVAGLIRALQLDTDDLQKFDSFKNETAGNREFFICTHGARDACCGTFGFPAYQKLRTQFADESTRVWRTSHTGGHRFAPNVLEYPVGIYWAWVTGDSLKNAVNREGDVNDLYQQMRGWAGAGRLEQVVEREIFMIEGWKWLNYAKRGTTYAGGETYASPAWLHAIDDADVEIQFASPDGSEKGTYKAHLEYTGDAPFGGCGKALGFERQFKVTSLEKTSN